MKLWLQCLHTILQRLLSLLTSRKALDMPGSSMFPALTGRLRSLPAQALKNYRNATCYVNAGLQVLVHLPHVASVPAEEWKQRCVPQLNLLALLPWVAGG